MSAIQKALEAMEDLRDDLLERASVDSDGTRVVNASNGRWIAFCDAIQVLQSLEGEAVATVVGDDIRFKRGFTDSDIIKEFGLKHGDKLYTTPQPPAVPDEDALPLEHGVPYVLQKSGMYYAHNSSGYVSRVFLAELFTKGYAENYANKHDEIRAVAVTELLTGPEEVQEYIDRLQVMKSALTAAQQGDSNE